MSYHLTWAGLTTAEPRLTHLLAAATELVEHRQGPTAEAAYVMAKPLIGWLTGRERGRTPRHAAQRIPAGSRLWAMTKVARPFHDDTPTLATDDAYTAACRHIHARLHHAEQRRQTA